MARGLTAAQRESLLRRRGKKAFACPEKAPYSGSYPIHDLERIVNARARWNRPGTYKCRGGKKRICAAARRKGLMKPAYPGTAGWKKFCRVR